MYCLQACVCVCALFSPEILQAGAVMGLMQYWRNGNTCVTNVRREITPLLWGTGGGRALARGFGFNTGRGGGGWIKCPLTFLPRSLSPLSFTFDPYNLPYHTIPFWDTFPSSSDASLSFPYLGFLLVLPCCITISHITLWPHSDLSLFLDFIPLFPLTFDSSNHTKLCCNTFFSGTLIVTSH